jgi:thioesterase domain-containing protein
MTSVLGREVDVDDDFFRMGGDSLAALVTVTRLEESLGRPVMVTHLVEHPTPRSLAIALSGADGGRAGRPAMSANDVSTRHRSIDGALAHPLVEWLHGDPHDTSLPALVLFAHGGSGHLLGYYDLLDGLRATGVRHRIVGFRLPGADDRTEPQWTIESQVDAFVDAFETLVGDGPCVLLGGSSGGLLAWEVARRRRATGHVGDTVLFMDTVHPDALRELRGSRWRKYERVWSEGGVRAVAGELRRVVDGRRLRLAARTNTSRHVLAPMGAARLAAVRVEESVDRSAMAYRPLAQPVRTVLVAAANTDRSVTERRWRPLTPELVVVAVEGDHNGPDSIGAAHRAHQVVAVAVDELARLSEL